MSNCMYSARNEDTIEHFGALPGGSYTQTCENCIIDEDKLLHCKCENINLIEIYTIRFILVYSIFKISG